MSRQHDDDDDGQERRRSPPSMFYPSIGKAAQARDGNASDDDGNRPTGSGNNNTASHTSVSAQTVQQHIDEEERHRTFYSARQQEALRILQEARDLVLSATLPATEAGSDVVATGSPYFPFRYPPSTDTATTSALTTLRVTLQPAGARRYTSAALLPHSIDNETLDAMLAQNLTAALVHIDRLIRRIEDRTSKVLVTGDVNAGKSTLINALLRQDILQTDQQPCTSAFFEVSEPKEGEEAGEVRAIPDPDAYDPNNVMTYTPFTHAHIKVSSATLAKSSPQQSDDYRLWRVVCRDDRPGSANLLSNGLVNVSFIDTPGLNRDISKTMSVFARQAEIDAVIFVVNSENHFTLSGVEFIENTRQEKPFIFVAVNRFDVIADKEKCRSRVMEQIEQLLPDTAANAEELVHFISARDIVMQLHDPNAPANPTQQLSLNAFNNLEACLRTFLLEKRLKTKMQPLKTYLTNLLTDMIALSRNNQALARSELEMAERALAHVSPSRATMQSFHATFTNQVDATCEELSASIHLRGRTTLEQMIVQTAQIVGAVPYPGLLRVWSYVDAVMDELNGELSRQLDQHYKFARSRAEQSASGLYHMAEVAVPGWADHWTAASRDPYAPLNNIADSSMHGDLEMLNVHFTALDLVEVPAPSVAMSSFAVGSVSVLVSGVIGFRRVATGVVRVGGLLGLRSASAFLIATVSAAGMGACAYVMWDVQGVVQRRIVRKARHQLRYSEQRVHRPFKRVQYVTDKSMREIAFHFQKTAGTVKDQLDRQYHEQAAVREQAEKRRAYFADVADRADGLLSVVCQLDTVGTPVQVRSGIFQRVRAIGRLLDGGQNEE